MRKCYWLLASGYLALSLISCSQKTLITEIANQVDKSLVLIKTKDQVRYGTGFVISGNKETCTVLTTNNRFPSQSQLQLQTYDGKVWQENKIKSFPQENIALVTFKQNDTECNYQALKIGNSDQLQSGQRLYISGFLKNSQNKFIKQFVPAEVKDTTSLFENNWLAYHAFTRRGMIGSPIVNKGGEVVAIHGLPIQSASNSDEEEDNYVKKGIPINNYLNLIDKQSFGNGPILLPIYPKWLLTGTILASLLFIIQRYYKRRNHSLSKLFQAFKNSNNKKLSPQNEGVSFRQNILYLRKN